MMASVLLLFLKADMLVRYMSPVNPAVYPHLAVTLLGIGLFFMAWFFVYPPSSFVSKHVKLVFECILYDMLFRLHISLTTIWKLRGD